MSEPSKLNLPLDSVVFSEIAQQPTLWPTTLDRVLAAGVPQEVLDLPVLLTGAGTSAYAALATADAWPGARAIPTTDLLLQSAAEILTAMPSFAGGGLLISFARSGDSPESVAVVERIKKLFPSVKHLAIVCNSNGRLAQLPGVDVISLDPRTNDRSLAMTSSFSNLALGGLCLIHHQQIGKYLPDICSRFSERLPDLNDAAEEVARSCVDRVVVLASSMHALAGETALKVIELTAGRVLALPETFLGFRHGPAICLRKDTPVVCFASSAMGKRRYEKDMLEELRSRGLGRLVVVGDDAASGWQHDCFVPAGASDLPDFLRTPFEIPFSQLLAYHLSMNAGVNPDDPSPNGTVTRVVTPFRIHEEILVD